MADEPPGKNKHDLAEVTCRVVMDVKIRIRQITPESVADEFTPSDDVSLQWAERQGRLLLALMSNGEALTKPLCTESA